MFIDIEPIIEENRRFIISKMIESNKNWVNLSHPIEFEESSIFRITLDTEFSSIRFDYRYGDKKNYYDWFLINEIPESIENKVYIEVLNQLSE